MLHYRCKAAALSVPGCCTFLVPLFEYLYIDLIKKNRVSHHGVFYTDSFFDLSFDFDCTLAGQGDFRRILQVAALAFLRAIYVCKIIAYHTTI